MPKILKWKISKKLSMPSCWYFWNKKTTTLSSLSEYENQEISGIFFLVKPHVFYLGQQTSYL